MLRGLRRSAPLAERLTISLSLLRLVQVLPSVGFSVYKTLLFCSAFLLWFFGAFRISELAVSRANVSGLVYSDVCFCEDHLLIWFAVPRGSSLCPVEVLCLFFDVRSSAGLALLS